MTGIAIAQAFADAVTGQLGLLLITIGIAVAGLRVVFSGGHHWGGLFAALGGGVVVVSAAWIVKTYLNGGGGLGI